MKPIRGTWQQAARRLKSETYALYLAYRDPRTPWLARLWAGLVAAYAFSPIDLVPDFIPVLGYLDDLILVPAGIWLALRLIPPQVLAECREQAQREVQAGKPLGGAAAVVIVVLWVAGSVLIVLWMASWLR